MTRVELLGCACPRCGKPVLAAVPAGLGRGSPCGESIAQLATYLRRACDQLPAAVRAVPGRVRAADQ